MGSENVFITTFSNEEMLKCGALTGYHQSDFAVMADDSYLEWLFANKKRAFRQEEKNPCLNALKNFITRNCIQINFRQ